MDKEDKRCEKCQKFREEINVLAKRQLDVLDSFVTGLVEGKKQEVQDRAREVVQKDEVESNDLTMTPYHIDALASLLEADLRAAFTSDELFKVVAAVGAQEAMDQACIRLQSLAFQTLAEALKEALK